MPQRELIAGDLVAFRSGTTRAGSLTLVTETDVDGWLAPISRCGSRKLIGLVVGDRPVRTEAHVKQTRVRILDGTIWYVGAFILLGKADK